MSTPAAHREALVEKAHAAVRAFVVAEDDARRTKSQEQWGHPGAFVGEHHVDFARVTEVVVDALLADHALVLTVETGVERCDLDHGGTTNAATVYGHRGSVRTCLRLLDDTWIYDPRWEQA